MDKKEALLFVKNQLDEVKSWSVEKKNKMIQDISFTERKIETAVLADHLKLQVYSRFAHHEGISLDDVFDGFLRVSPTLLRNIEDLKKDVEWLEGWQGSLEWQEHAECEPLKEQAVIHYFDVTGVNAGMYRGDGHYSSTLGGFLGGDVTHYIVRHWSPSKAI